MRDMTRRSHARRIIAILIGAVVGLALTGSAADAATPTASSGPEVCHGWGGVLNNVVGLGSGGLSPAILGEAELGDPDVDGGVVSATGTVPFYSWGSCSSQVAFQMQTKVCGYFGCNWVTRNHGTWEFFWAHDDSGFVSQRVAMSCRRGTNSYRIHMAVTNVVSAAEEGEGEGAAAGAVGAELESDGEDGPVATLTC
jgi:hypothetical protein